MSIFARYQKPKMTPAQREIAQEEFRQDCLKDYLKHPLNLNKGRILPSPELNIVSSPRVIEALYENRKDKPGRV